MKKWAKEQLERVKLLHIKSLIVGVLLTEFITWLLFKNPKKITAPGLSATVAVCALLLAIYSAYQVKKWVNSKINEKAFKRSEELLEEFLKLMVILARLKYALQHVAKTEKLTEKNALTLKEEINKIQDDYFICISNQILLIHSFSHWEIIFKCKKYWEKTRVHLTICQSECNTIREQLAMFTSNANQAKKLSNEDIKTLANSIIGRIDTVGYIYDGILKRKYNDIFKYSNN
ncbi:hypothetical protein [Enterobacter hormaechei]|uniref:hypothetical protein n=1 Tax=Enterobacter hormaechei TaxID=158836 RepID=UPI002DBE41A1|nr:hypothetical protein [Enterobacter hormaechei]MEB8025551.1 hypothetical protein [Enterobacter hormaechei]